ncbi:MAG: outer membrane lipoprotein carrier protein LolA [Desulfoarculaceae bacterium]|nr:outer membrane lipoprotein carrier protein LolA [Desulfoarculaceae bacterium]
MKPFLPKTPFPFRVLLLTVTALLCLLPPSIIAGQNDIETPEDIARRLQQTYDQISSLSFHFTQNTTGELTGRPQQGGGTALFVKEKKSQGIPEISGKMRWDYTTPDKQVLVSDGLDFSMYFARLEQMIVSPAEVMRTDITYSFFTGSGNLLNDFSISAPNPEFAPGEDEADRFKVVKLTPKENQSQVNEIHLWVTKDSLIQRIDILDHFDTRTTLDLSDLQINTLPTDDRKAMEALFTFTPPEGTEIIYQ